MATKKELEVGALITYKPNKEVLSKHFRTDKQTFNESGNPAIVIADNGNDGYTLNVFTIHGLVVIEGHLAKKTEE